MTSAAAPGAGEVLRAELLVRDHGAESIVRGVSLEVEAGEAVAVVGPSGCGKTTLLQMLGLLDRPTSGRVLIEGVDGFAQADERRARLRLARIGFVFQQHNLFDHLTARDNIALPAWRMGGSRDRALAVADALLDRLGLTRRSRELAARLSTGEAQRVAIARALANRPRLVLADEPTGSLDSRAAASVLDAFQEVRRAGAALVLVTHDAAIAARMERVLSMLDGALTT